MQVKLDSLYPSLERALQPVYLIAGDETLLVEEACDAIVHQAAAAGFNERSIHYAEGGFKWHELTHDAASLSLFGNRKLLDVRVRSDKLDRQASDALRAWLEEPSHAEDTVLLIRMPRLDGRQRNSAWFKALDKHGVVVLVWPLTRNELPRWLQGRLQAAGLRAEPDALDYVCDRVEGNLLSAVQEVHKLSLMNLTQPMRLQDVAECLEDSSRFTSFDLLDAVMSGAPQRVAHILTVLREEGVSLFSIVGALTSQIRRRDSARLPRGRADLAAKFYRRIKQPDRVLAECAVIDQQLKGQLQGDPWLSLERLLLRLAGCRVVALPSTERRWVS